MTDVNGDRRQFMFWAITAFVSAALAQAEGSHAWLLTLTDAERSQLLGLKARLHSNLDPDFLENVRQNQTGLRDWVQERVRSDYLNGRVENVGGWVFSRTEVQVLSYLAASM